MAGSDTAHVGIFGQGAAATDALGEITIAVSYTHLDVYKRQAVNNSTTAWLYGASGVNCSLFGIGERTGNTPLEAMVFEMCIRDRCRCTIYHSH